MADVKKAEKLVVAARENVRFLTRHLRKYRAHLELPASVDNALYLAYTIRTKGTAPFHAGDLRRYLHKAGIETTSSFGFDARENSDTADDRQQSPRAGSSTNEGTFCLACHQYLTIPDLEYIVYVFDSFFDRLRSTTPASEDRRN